MGIEVFFFFSVGDVNVSNVFFFSLSLSLSLEWIRNMIGEFVRFNAVNVAVNSSFFVVAFKESEN